MDNVQNSEPTLTIDLEGDLPVVQQIVNGLRHCLLRGELQPGERLPSSRALARDLGVHFNTVAQAYRELEAEGWLTLRRRAGTVVLARETPKPNADQARQLQSEFVQAVRNLLVKFEARGLTRAELIRLAAEATDNRTDKGN
jgi:GntR family transcriptional regulator